MGKKRSVTTDRLLSAIYTVCINGDAHLNVTFSACCETNTVQIERPLLWFQEYESLAFCTQRNAGVGIGLRTAKVVLTLQAREFISSNESAKYENGYIGPAAALRFTAVEPSGLPQLATIRVVVEAEAQGKVGPVKLLGKRRKRI